MVDTHPASCRTPILEKRRVFRFELVLAGARPSVLNAPRLSSPLLAPNKSSRFELVLVVLNIEHSLLFRASSLPLKRPQ